METEGLSGVQQAAVVAMATLQAQAEDAGCHEIWTLYDDEDVRWCDAHWARLERMTAWVTGRYGPLQAGALGVLAYSALANGDVDTEGRV